VDVVDSSGLSAFGEIKRIAGSNDQQVRAVHRSKSGPLLSALGLGCVETPWEREEFALLAAFASGRFTFLRSDYVLIAAMRGWMPMMFITRVRL
jgi:hypothetical protein